MKKLTPRLRVALAMSFVIVFGVMTIELAHGNLAFVAVAVLFVGLLGAALLEPGSS